MSRNADIESFMLELEKINGSFVVKDFVGFLNWEPTMGALLLPFTGHHMPFCQSIKSEPALYHRCVVCSKYSQRLCIRAQKPFLSTCYLGISEYTIPIQIGNFCVGSLSVGAYNGDRATGHSRLRRAVARYGLDFDALQSDYEECTIRQMPSENSYAVFRFAAAFLANAFASYAVENIQTLQRSRPPVNNFERVQRYIHMNYTDPNINVAAIANACNYSSSSVSHIFNTRMNMSIRAYINHLRIVLAKKELRDGNNVAVTAMICGFNDPNYFSNVFRSLVGIPPSQYAKYEQKKAVFNLLPDTQPY